MEAIIPPAILKDSRGMHPRTGTEEEGKEMKSATESASIMLA